MQKKKYIDEVIQIDVDQWIYHTLREDFNPAFYSFGCPIGHKICGELNEIMKEYSKKNVFIAIPYSNYPYENAILEVVEAANLSPKLAKQKIQTKVVLCKICKEIRKSCYGIVDISEKNVNVAYELGLMQSLGKNCAILLRSGTEAQSDLRGIENVMYDNLVKLISELGRWMEDNIPQIDKNSLHKFLHVRHKSGES